MLLSGVQRFSFRAAKFLEDWVTSEGNREGGWWLAVALVDS